MKTKISDFAESIRGLLDDTDLLSRREWADFLGVSTAAISQWVRDKTIPRYDHLMVIYDLVTHREVPRTPVENFERMAKLESMCVSPHGERMEPTVWEYMRTSPYPRHVVEQADEPMAASIERETPVAQAAPASSTPAAEAVAQRRTVESHGSTTNQCACLRDSLGRSCIERESELHSLETSVEPRLLSLDGEENSRLTVALHQSSRLTLALREVVDELIRAHAEATKPHRILITGSPGSGKSHFACLIFQQLLSAWHDQQSQNLHFYHAACLPKLSSVDDFIKFIASEGRPIDAGRQTLLFLDGIDEIEFNRRRAFARMIKDCGITYPKLGFVLFSRPVEELDEIHGFNRYELQPHSLQSVANWVELAISTLVRPAERKRFTSCSDFVADLRQRPYILNTINRPLFLRAATKLFARNGVTPEFETDLLEECTSLLIDKWDREKRFVRVAESWARPANLLKILTVVSFNSCKKQSEDFDLSDVSEWLRPLGCEAPVHRIMCLLSEGTGLFSLKADHRWEFNQREFRTYLAARYLVESFVDTKAFFQTSQHVRDREKLVSYACALTTDATPLIIQVLNITDTQHAETFALLAKALSQDIACNPDVIRKSYMMLVKWLDDGFAGFELETKKIDDPLVSWSIRATNKHSPRVLTTKTGTQLRRVLGILHTLRTGRNRKCFKEIAANSRSEVVRSFGDSLEVEGHYVDAVESDSHGERLSARIEKTAA